MGQATIEASATSFRKSSDNNLTMLLVLAPSTFRIPISRMRWVMVNADNPNRPRQAMKMAMLAKMVKMVPCLCSD